MPLPPKQHSDVLDRIFKQLKGLGEVTSSIDNLRAFANNAAVQIDYSPLE